MTMPIASYAGPLRTRKPRAAANWSNPFGVAFVFEWRRRIRERNELARLGIRDLADFACSKADASAETDKWFWQG